MFSSLLPQFGSASSKEGGVTVLLSMSLVFGDEFLAQGLQFKVTPEVFSWD